MAASAVHVAPWKREAVTELVIDLKKSPVVGVVDIHGIPAPQFQLMRRNLRPQAQIRVLKRTLLKLALGEASKDRKGLEQLEKALEGQCAIVTSTANPFRLYKHLEATKTKMAARGGELAPEDIEVRAQETSFKPGPIVGELQKAGIPAAIDAGKVIIKKDKLVVKRGERIPRDLALALSKLEIYPLTIGLDLKAAFENGTVFERHVLAVDDVALLGQVRTAARSAFALALEIGYATPRTIRPLLARAHNSALALAVSASIPTKESLKLLLAKANAQVLSLAARLKPEALDDDLRARLSAAPPTPAPSAAPVEEPKQKREQAAEEEAASGLGALFG